MSRVFVALGSNIGDRKRILEKALARLEDAFKLKAVSSLFESWPWGYKDQGNFLNAVIEIETSMQASELLGRLKVVEREFGRESNGLRWGPRPLDLDILLYGQDIIEEENLKIPHLELKNRSFQLLPLLELDSELKDPRNGRYFKIGVENLPGDIKIERVALFNKEKLCWDEDI